MCLFYCKGIFYATLGSSVKHLSLGDIEKSCQATGKGQKDSTCLIGINTHKGVT